MSFFDNHSCNAFSSDVSDCDRFSPTAIVVSADMILERGCALRVNVKDADSLKSVYFGPDGVPTVEQECDLDQIRLVMAHARTALFGKVRIAYEMKDGRTLSIVP